MSLWTPPILFADRIGNFYLRLFLLLRKASNAITRLPKAHNNVNMPMKIERISKAVIHATSLPMYSGKPVIWYREATSSLRYGRRQTSVHRTLSALSWVLSYGLHHATNISFFFAIIQRFSSICLPLFGRCLHHIFNLNHPDTLLSFYYFNRAPFSLHLFLTIHLVSANTNVILFSFSIS